MISPAVMAAFTASIISSMPWSGTMPSAINSSPNFSSRFSGKVTNKATLAFVFVLAIFSALNAASHADGSQRSDGGMSIMRMLRS